MIVPEVTRHAVVLHSSGHSGYVVRTAYQQADGTFWIPNPYQNATPVKLYTREHAAQALADKLNAGYVRPLTPNEGAEARERELSRPW